MNRTGWPLLRSPPTVLAVQAALGLWTGNGEEMWKSYRKRWNTKRIEEVKPGRADRLGEKNAERAVMQIQAGGKVILVLICFMDSFVRYPTKTY